MSLKAADRMIPGTLVVKDNPTLAAHVLHQPLETLERTVEHCSRNGVVAGQKQQRSDCPHRSAPKPNLVDPRVHCQVGYHQLQVLLLVEPQRNVLTLGVAAPAEVESAQRQAFGYQFEEVLHAG